MHRRPILIIVLAIGLGLVALGSWLLWPAAPEASHFDGQRAYGDVLAQMALGPRPVGSEAHMKVRAYIQSELEASGWGVEILEAEMMGHPIQNIVARRGDASPEVILGAHYDSRLLADRDLDPAKRTQAVPGADDGASGVAVLLELARTLPQETIPVELVFFDAEDNGDIPGWDWILGSQAFVSALETRPQAMILVDMVGQADLALPQEGYSDPTLTHAIWETGRGLGYGDTFLDSSSGGILDDHIPFIQAGIPSVDIIDINYPYWHTTADTADKVSPESLAAVGATLLEWVKTYSRDHPSR